MDHFDVGASSENPEDARRFGHYASGKAEGFS
jgi:hypothetical protein